MFQSGFIWKNIPFPCTFGKNEIKMSQFNRFLPGLIFIGILTLIFLMVFRPEPAPIFKVSPVKKVVERIEQKETDVSALMEQISNDKSLIISINGQLTELKRKLNNAKLGSDTLRIIQMQDLVINTQDSSIARYEQLTKRQDSVIIDQRYIINSKDTIIALKDHQIRKVKKQRNRSLILNGVAAGILTSIIFIK